MICSLGVVLYTFFYPESGDSSLDDGPLIQEVIQGPFVYRVTETGKTSSSKNVEVRCEVKARGTPGTPIVEIVPEGTLVKTGDILVKLDSTAFEKNLVEQQMAVSKSDAALIKATNEYETAVIALAEYTHGTFYQEEKTIENEITVANENYSRAQQHLAYSKNLAKKGYVTSLQLQADEFAVQKADDDRKIAESKLNVLRKFTKEKNVSEFTAKVKTAKASLDSSQSSHELEGRKLEDIQTQIDKCTLRAPSPGQVVHANIQRRHGTTTIIEQGLLVRENQAIIRLPDSSQMQVTATINESRINLVHSGMHVKVRVDAIPDLVLDGEVTVVNEYPEPGHWSKKNVNAYGTTIRILGTYSGLRPGMSAEVDIEVARRDDAIQVPVTAVLEHGGEHYCFMRQGDGWDPVPRKLKLGPSNDLMVVAEEGLAKGDIVAANPRRHLKDVDLPEIKAEEKKNIKGAKKNKAQKKGPGSAGKPPRDKAARKKAQAEKKARKQSRQKVGAGP